MLAHPKQARVLFDEAHSEAWTVRPELASRMQPAHPGDSSLELAARALAERDFEVAVHERGPLDERTLADAQVLVIAHPSDEAWEATTGSGSPRFEPRELDALAAWVERGGGLLVLAETEEDKYGTNLGELLERFGVRVVNATVQDYEHSHGAPSWVLAELPHGAATQGADPLARVSAACFYRAGALELRNGGRPIALAHPTSTHPGAPLAALVEHGRGRVAVFADSDLFGDDCIGELDHAALWCDVIYWLAEPAFDRPASRPRSEAAADPAWARLKEATEELRTHQAADGSIPADAAAPRERLRELVAAISEAVGELAPRFPHEREYLDALRADLRDWAAADFRKPDFIRSIDSFRPERERRDGIEHLVLFPMYKQNASRDTALEALIVRVPWPDWVAELEARYENPKYLPVELVDYTSGYDSECAVLFPETFAAAERSPAHFGAIFCDREAERLRRVCGAAADILRLNLPPDAAALLRSPEISRDAYIVWDLIHDRTHMRGDLPFDPFMIRQRSPYWMYSLEELRCDLTAFGEALALEREGFAFARHAQYAILLDRLFRFPVTGSRVRNYDGLGGQLLFAFLHKEGYLHWTDNRLTIEWDRVAEGVERLRARVAELYHSGIDRSKLAQWIAAHDLVAEYVPPAERSVWARERRELPDVEEPKELVDLVLDDEFPLSLFYTQLRPKLEPFLARPESAL